MADATITPPPPGLSGKDPIPEYKYVTPLWHTLLFLLLIAAVSFYTAHSPKPGGATSRVPQYLFTMAWLWFLFFYIVIFAHGRGTKLKELIGGRWENAEDGLLDIAIAVGFWVVSVAVLAGLGWAMGLTKQQGGPSPREMLEFLAPMTVTELVLWAGLSATAGFVEEVVFRGYLQRQFTALTRNVWVGIALSGIVFGLGHGYQGGRRMILIAVYGSLFGVLAHFRKSLRPGMMAHAWHDLFIGYMLSFAIKSGLLK